VAVEIVLGFAVGGTALYVGWRRIRAYGEYWRYNHQADAFEKAMKMAREDLAADRVIRAANQTDAELVEMIDSAVIERKAIEACGFTLLGDVVVDVPDRRPHAIVRVFVDAAGTTCAQLSVFANHPRRRYLTVVTYRDDDLHTTRRSQQGTLAEAPFSHRLSLANDTPYSKVVEEHRKAAPADGAHKIATLDDAIAQLTRFREKTVAWRGSKSPDELLDLDLRGVLGDKYDKLGKMWTRRLRERLPEATLRRN
jgi:hypothetical protein